jgi:hypothetical protein
MGLVPVPEELLRKRLEALREYRWSSYPAYAGWSAEPEWLTVNAVLVGGQKRGLGEQRTAYRTYVETVKGEAWDRFRDRHGDWGRDLALYLARRHGGLSLPVLADCSGASSYDAVSKALHRMAVRLKEDEQMRKLADKAATCLVVQT